MKQRGFTIIEILIVIAIIGILSSVVLVALNTARSKGADATIKAQLSQIRNQAGIVYDSAGCYNEAGTPGSACDVEFPVDDCSTLAGTLFANTNVSAQITAAGNASDGTGIARASCVEDATDQNWAVSVPLKTAITDSWCVDSTGTSKKVTPAGDPSDRGFAATACK